MSSSSANPFCSSPFYENPNSSFLMEIPTSMLDDEGLLLEHLLHHQPLLPSAVAPPEEPPEKVKRKRVGSRKPPVSNGRRRVGKKDRHSKIYTAQGPRDRRMRLSLQIARKFFDLQDMLGFDKASKTIEWLFSKSKTAIRELASSLQMPHQNTGSCTSCDDDHKKDEEMKGLKGAKSSYSISFTKESREKARARARQRTMEKKKQKGLMLLKTSPNSNSSETVDQVDSGVSGGGHEFNSRSEMGNHKSSLGIIEKLLGSDSSTTSSSSIYDHNFLGCPGNWVVDSMSMNPSYGAMSGVDELQVILQQNPNSVAMHLQSRSLPC